MRINLKTQLLLLLAGSSSQQPVDTAKLYKLGKRDAVEAALLELYHAHQVCCCKVTKGKQENIVWWLSGGVTPLGHSRMCAPKKRRAA